MRRFLSALCASALLAACGTNDNSGDDSTPVTDSGVADDATGGDSGVADGDSVEEDTGPNPAVIPDACSEYCAVELECSSFYETEQECLDACIDEYAANIDFGELCETSLDAYYGCLGTLTCDELDEWADATGEDYPCASEQSRRNRACSEDGAPGLVACEEYCDAAVACGADTAAECFTDCEESVSGEGECGEAWSIAYECASQLSCEEIAGLESGRPISFACIDEVRIAGFECATGLGADCFEACEVFDRAAAACGWFEQSLRMADGSEVLYVSVDNAFAAYVESWVEGGLDMLREQVGENVGVGWNPRHNLVVVDGAPASMVQDLVAQLAIGMEPVVALRSPDGRVAVPTGDIVVRFEDNAADISRILQDNGLVLSHRIEHRSDLYVVSGPRYEQAFEVADKLFGEESVIFAEPDMLRRYELRDLPNDPLLSSQWHLRFIGEGNVRRGTDINATDAWDLEFGSRDIIVAINDDGVDFSHEDLADAMVPGWQSPFDEAELRGELDQGCCSHGTAVAGVAAGIGDNGIGVSGVCPGCSIMPVFGLWVDFESDSVIAESLSWPAQNGAAVINNSWGPAGGSPIFADERPGGWGSSPLPSVIEDAIQFCDNESRDGLGTVLVFAAGNGNETTEGDGFSSHPNVVTVASVNDQGIKSYYSNFGPHVDVAAPSDGGWAAGITTTDIMGGNGYNGGNYTNSFGGTSSASPVVAGLAGLVRSANPELTSPEVRELLRETADRIDPIFGDYGADDVSTYYGAGRVNAYAAVRRALELGGEECVALGEERCNGFDDDCDGEIDEGCDIASVCEPCDYNHECASGQCAFTGGDVGGRCVELCGEGCAEGFACEAGVCLPLAGRCDSPADEECNGVDDDLDGQVDEDACPVRGAGEFCRYEAECGVEGTCVANQCLTVCDDNTDCGEERQCVEITYNDGAPAGVGVCVRQRGGGFDCPTVMCSGEYIPVGVAQGVIDCLREVVDGPNFCADAGACIPF